MSHPPINLDYHLEWGGRNWNKLASLGLNQLGENWLKDKTVLEIGSRSGKMATYFALNGATVTGIDLNENVIPHARAEALKHGVENNVNFLTYNGDLDLFEDASFDFIFTKSVLVVVPNLRQFLLKIDRKLKPGGKVVFLENGYGNLIINLARRIRHRDWNSQQAHFFNKSDMVDFRDIFEISTITRSHFPPVWLITGCKKT